MHRTHIPSLKLQPHYEVYERFDPEPNPLYILIVRVHFTVSLDAPAATHTHRAITVISKYYLLIPLPYTSRSVLVTSRVPPRCSPKCPGLLGCILIPLGVQALASLSDARTRCGYSPRLALDPAWSETAFAAPGISMDLRCFRYDSYSRFNRSCSACRSYTLDTLRSIHLCIRDMLSPGSGSPIRRNKYPASNRRFPGTFDTA